MEMNSANVEAVVKQVLESMLEKKVPEAAPAQKAAGNEIPKTAHVAMLTALEHFEIKEYPMPEVGDGDILVKVEGRSRIQERPIQPYPCSTRTRGNR